MLVFSGMGGSFWYADPVLLFLLVLVNWFLQARNEPECHCVLDEYLCSVAWAEKGDENPDSVVLSYVEETVEVTVCLF